jgi:hypothetical protein
MPTKTITINRFDKGMATDPRSKEAGKFYFSKHFDAFSFPHKLTPRYKVTAINSGDDVDDYGLKSFAYAMGPSATMRVFGLGQNSLNKAVIFFFDDDSDSWVSPSGNLSGTSDVPIFETFFYYKNYAYWLAGTTKLQRYSTPDGSGGITDYQTLTAFSLGAKPLIDKEDNAYFFHNNLVSRLDNTTWDGTVCTLPSDASIYQACEYGDYLVLAAKKSFTQNTDIYFWNKDSSVVDFSQKFRIPADVYQMAVINGRLIIVSTDFIKIYVHRFNGAEFEQLNELRTIQDDYIYANVSISRHFTIFENKLLFPMNFEAPGYANGYNDRDGIWAVDENGRITLDNTVAAATAYYSIFNDRGKIFYSYNNAAEGETAVVNLAMTATEYSESNISAYETLFLGEVQQNKQLLSVGVMTEPLPAAGSIVLKYRLEENSPWTTIFTNTTDSSRYHQAVNIESTGGSLPEFREIQFRVESLGGAVLVGLNLNYEEIDDNPNL